LWNVPQWELPRRLTTQRSQLYPRTVLGLAELDYQFPHVPVIGHDAITTLQARFNLLRFETGSDHDGHSPAETADDAALRMPPQTASNP